MNNKPFIIKFLLPANMRNKFQKNMVNKKHLDFN
jgi:hypothetical protein